MRYRRLGPGDRQRPCGATPGYGERGDPDVPVEVTGFGAVYAEAQEDIKTGGDPACDRLHLRPPVGVGEPSCSGTV